MNGKADGLIHALVLDGQGGSRSLDWEGVVRWQPDQGVLWLHLDYAASGAQAWLREQSGLDEVSAEVLLAEETRPRLVVTHQGLLVVMRGVNLNPGADPEDMVSIRIWLESDRVVSSLQRRLFSIERVPADLARQQGPANAGDLLVALAEALADGTGEVIDEISDAVDVLEDETLSGEAMRLRSALASLRRRAIALRRYLVPQREALVRLASERTPFLSEMEHSYLREVADAFTRHVEDLEAARERAAVCQEELDNRLSEQVGGRMYLLSLVAVIFLPLTFVTGLFGMNLSGMPGADGPMAFWFVTGILIVVAFLLLLLFRKWRWI